MVFSVILIAPDLSAADYQQAAAGGPTFIETHTPYPDMPEQTGCEITEHINQTADYHATFVKMFAQEQAKRDEFVRVHGEEGASALFIRRQATGQTPPLNNRRLPVRAPDFAQRFDDVAHTRPRLHQLDGDRHDVLAFVFGDGF